LHQAGDFTLFHEEDARSNNPQVENLSSFCLIAAIHTDSCGYVRQAAILTENNLVMKQQRSTYTAVGTETSVRADEKLPLGSSTINSIRPSFKNC
jgi:hypothetical protein